ncbi:hypothetical protein TanjilG_04174 [Lupinus angustifolius]|uniref:Inositol polyphosphate-related phosphatase domain-containing protein n=1 Tax=Lupinus angustifolius TaxID=3871 RepID=A0A4P1RJI0_LUPAN|nr:hypothetical protein TanjilG_04174 [Lupinus angustifolius]
MEVEKKKPRYPCLFNWFHKEDKQSYSLNEIEDALEDESDDYDLSLQSLEFDDPYILTNKLRIFVGTWNVAGKSPVGSLAVDLEDWLNLNNAAEIYVLGFQEIVPLKTLTVIGVEEPAVTTTWNHLIGTILNKNLVSQSLPTPMLLNSSISHYMNNNPNYELVSNNNNKYTMVASKKMVGVFISVWLRNEVINKYF